MLYRSYIIGLLAVAACSIGFSSCQVQKSGSSNAPAKDTSCEGVICTMMFAAVTVKVLDAGNQPVVLDSTQTLDAAGKVVFRGQKNFSGAYTVLNDSYRKELAMRTGSFTFVGYIGGQAAVQGAYSISADCCHVKRSGGPEILTLK